jgi:hypothetical protein
MQAAEATTEHRWLQRLVGEWRYESEGEADPGEPPIRDTGTESVRPLGEVWMVCESRSEADESSSNIMTVGYDTEKKRFVGTFIGSMMTFLWLYEGQLDADGSTLVLESEGPSFAEEGTTARYRDTMEMRSDDHRVFTSSYLADDGSWHPFMTTRYRRVK